MLELDLAGSAPVRPLQICLLGGFRVFKQGRPVHVRAGSKTQHLLGNLALGPSPGIARESLLTMLWPGATATLAGQSLNTLVYSIHRLLGDAIAGQPPILHDQGRYRLNVEGGISVDVIDFDAALDSADRLLRSGRPDDALRTYRRATSFYRGDLVVDSDIQHLIERERLRARYLFARARIADQLFAAGRHEAALASALELLANDPCREDAHRMAMRCYIRLGERAQALRQYRLCTEALIDEFQAAPEAATRELYEQIRLDPSVV
jgi:DNA-binding SARP family transcriptional activator